MISFTDIDSPTLIQELARSINTLGASQLTSLSHEIKRGGSYS
jgi:hypothetical protein